MKWLMMVATGIMCALCVQAELKPFTSKPEKAQWWFDRLERNKREIAKSGGTYDVVMVGDSITHHWERCGRPSYDKLCQKYKVLNAGYGADGVPLALWRLQHGELDGYKAKVFIVMLGTNNFNVDPPTDVSKMIGLVLDEIKKRQPQATILLYPIFPRGPASDSPARLRVAKINELIRPLADGKQIIWTDMNGLLVNADGSLKRDLFFDDNLHPNAKGYELWLGELEKLLPKYLAKDAPCA